MDDQNKLGRKFGRRESRLAGRSLPRGAALLASKLWGGAAPREGCPQRLSAHLASTAAAAEAGAGAAAAAASMGRRAAASRSR